MNRPAMITRRPPAPNAEDWRRQLKSAFADPRSLLDWLGIDAAAVDTDPDAAFATRIPRAFAARMRPGDPADPLLRQVLPLAAERLEQPGYSADPVGDGASRAARGVLHKYVGRVLVITTGACAVHCRYCFRREFPYAAEHAAGDRWHQALDYIRTHPDIEEVILSGGDPLMLPTERLEAFTDALAGIDHIHRIRIHTRLPVVLPDRVDADLMAWLAGLRRPVVVIHANHPREFNAAVDAAVARMRGAGAMVLNQAVLLAGINDDADTLAGLMRRSFSAGALPYYLHLLDPVRGSGHFRVDDDHARRLVEHLRIHLSGYLVPRLVREQAGAPYKLPVL